MLRHEQQKSQGMLAGDFPTGAGACADRPGKVHPYLIGLGTASLAEPPCGGLVKAERLPFSGRSQAARRLDRRIVGGHGKNRLHRDVHIAFSRNIREKTRQTVHILLFYLYLREENASRYGP